VDFSIFIEDSLSIPSHSCSPGAQTLPSQEISLALSQSSEESTLVVINSQAILNPVEALVFGYCLAVDGGASERNVKQVSSFLKSQMDQTPGAELPVSGCSDAVLDNSCTAGKTVNVISSAICLAR